LVLSLFPPEGVQREESGVPRKVPEREAEREKRRARRGEGGRGR